MLGEVHAMTGRMTYRGKVMNRAARIASTASTGQVRQGAGGGQAGSGRGGQAARGQAGSGRRSGRQLGGWQLGSYLAGWLAVRQSVRWVRERDFTAFIKPGGFLGRSQTKT